jgi:hypothetical protein
VTGTDDRHGQIFIAAHPDGGFGAYWDNEEPDKDEPPDMLEEAPPFTDVEDAIAWGRFALTGFWCVSETIPPRSTPRVLSA